VDGPDGERGAPHATPAELDSVVAGYEGAIEHFVSEGLADPQRIGVTGFSRFGLYTAYFLTHTSYPIAAANVADNADESYLQYLFWGASTKSEYERDVGAAPLGEGLRIWAERAPGFNADKIHAPLRMERDSQGLISALYSWELFSQLRYLRRPVELYLVPDIEHGAHALERPSQLLASQGAIVDWFDFWLNEHEDPNPAKTGQYERWRKLRSLRDSAPEGRTPKIGEIASLPQN
jgi:dipeptidyl aminopeptidase/acylaminoacyl peptidase